MRGTALTVGDVVRGCGVAFLESFGKSLSVDQRYALKCLAACRTAALGGHVRRCEHCGHEHPSYNSCRNRHCPSCQGSLSAQWLAARSAELLPVPYFHLVFTLPESIARIALQNPAVVYDLLMKTAADTVTEIASDHKHLGARIGGLSVLHTWGQNLQHHPHVHLVVPGGGLSRCGQRWIRCRGGRGKHVTRQKRAGRRRRKLFFLPVRVLSRLFRGKFLDRLQGAYREGQLRFHGRLAALNQAPAFARYLAPSARQEWVVYAKRPFASAECVLKYLARYTHRVAISNQRLVALADDRVTFRWKNYVAGGRQQTMTLSASEFLRRLLLHVLPKRFVRIRHFGILANRHRSENLARCRQLLGVNATGGSDGGAASAEEPRTSSDDLDEQLPDQCCPRCGRNRWRLVWSAAMPTAQTIYQMPWPFDTS